MVAFGSYEGMDPHPHAHALTVRWPAMCASLARPSTLYLHGRELQDHDRCNGGIGAEHISH
jgi:hypothetical protein